MELTYEETLQLGNSKEHLRVVLSNLRIASEELSNTLKLTEQAKLALEKSYKDRDVVVQLANDTWNKMIAKGIELDNRELVISERENKVNLSEEEINNRLVAADNKIKEIEKQSSEMISNLSKTSEELKSNIVNYQTDIALLKLELENLNEEIKKTVLVKKNTEDEVAGLNNKREVVEKEIEKLNKYFQDRLLKIESEIEEEKKKIELPMELIRREQDKIDRETRDLRIIRKRLQVQYQQQNPDRILPIELQEQDGER